MPGFCRNLEELPALRICSSETPLRGQYCGRFSNSRRLGDIDVDAPRLVAKPRNYQGFFFGSTDGAMLLPYQKGRRSKTDCYGDLKQVHGIKQAAEQAALCGQCGLARLMVRHR